MGSINAELIRRCERARRAGDKEALDKWAKAVEASQAACDHSEQPFRTQRVLKSSSTGRYRRDDLVTWCCTCSKVLSSSDPDIIGVVEVPDAADAYGHSIKSNEKILLEAEVALRAYRAACEAERERSSERAIRSTEQFRKMLGIPRKEAYDHLKVAIEALNPIGVPGEPFYGLGRRA